MGGREEEGSRVEQSDSHESGTDTVFLLERSQNLLSGPNLVEIPILFKLCEVDLLDLLDVLRAVSLL